MVEMKPNNELLDDLAEMAADLPHWRLHVHPDSAPWLSMSVQHKNLHPHVTLVPDPACRDLGLGWVEYVSAERWQQLKAMIGSQVIVLSHLGLHHGILSALSRSEARVTAADGTVYHLRWIEIGPRQ